MTDLPMKDSEIDWDIMLDLHDNGLMDDAIGKYFHAIHDLGRNQGLDEAVKACMDSNESGYFPEIAITELIKALKTNPTGE